MNGARTIFPIVAADAPCPTCLFPFPLPVADFGLKADLFQVRFVTAWSCPSSNRLCALLLQFIVFVDSQRCVHLTPSSSLFLIAGTCLQAVPELTEALKNLKK